MTKNVCIWIGAISYRTDSSATAAGTGHSTKLIHSCAEALFIPNTRLLHTSSAESAEKVSVHQLETSSLYTTFPASQVRPQEISKRPGVE